jgi:hypothetical protein
MVTASAGCLDFGQPPSFSECGSPNAHNIPLPVQFNVSNWTAGTLTLTVRTVCSQHLTPSDVSYRIRSANLTQFLDGPPGTGPEVMGTRVTFAYADTNASGWLDRGDMFTLSVEPPQQAVLLAGGGLNVYNISNSRTPNAVGFAEIPFLGPPSIGLALSSHSANTTTINVTSVENLPPTPFKEYQITLFNRENSHHTYPDGDPHISWLDADADGALSAGDQLVIAADPSNPDYQAGGHLEVRFFITLVGTLANLP